ncbi:MAG: hypothetical protein LBJ31_03285, partial [Treponema sp.]|nr:hypothetical protein [Treponema sp.]
KDGFLLLAEYNREKNRTIYSILDKMSNEDREKERGSYYGTPSGYAPLSLACINGSGIGAHPPHSNNNV